jgi:hypothetical protein
MVRSSGERAFQQMEAAFLVYNQGPGTDERALYLTLGTAHQTAPPLEIELYQILPNKHESPTAGSYKAGYDGLGGDFFMVGDVRTVENERVKQYLPIREQSSVMLAEVTPECVQGQLDMVVVAQNVRDADSVATVVGTFTARRVRSYTDLPHPVGSWAGY